MSWNEVKKWRVDALTHAQAWMNHPVVGVQRQIWMLLVVATVLGFLSLYFWLTEIQYWVAETWHWLRREGDDESYGATIRNIMLILVGPIGLGFAIWRSTVAQIQANVAQKGLQNERYQRSAEMLGSDTLATRIGGIYSLERLAWEHPKEYHIQIMGLISAFVRDPKNRINVAGNTTQPQASTTRCLAQDIQEAITVIGRRSQKQRDLERDEGWRLDLSDMHLEGVNLRNAHLEGVILIDTHLEGANLENVHLERAYMRNSHLDGAYMRYSHLEGAHMEDIHLNKADLRDSHLMDSDLTNANLKEARLWRANLAHADMWGVNLEYAELEDADLKCASLEKANLRRARLKGVRNLTQAVLDSTAHYDKNGIRLLGPHLTGAFCAESGKPLSW